MKTFIDSFILCCFIASIPTALLYREYRKNEKIRTGEIDEAPLISVSSYTNFMNEERYKFKLDINKNGKFDEGDIAVNSLTNIFYPVKGDNVVFVHHRYGGDAVAVKVLDDYKRITSPSNLYGKNAEKLNDEFEEYMKTKTR
ncbi:MAG: hypothetical protein ACI4N3_02370 [Alphaproteobacteria bacterium]